MPSLTGSKTLNELINEGFIKAPTKIYGSYNGEAIEADLKQDGSIDFRGVVFTSLSVAAGKAVTTVAKVKSPGREYFSVNGWKFWHVKVGSSKKALRDIRDEASGA